MPLRINTTVYEEPAATVAEYLAIHVSVSEYDAVNVLMAGLFVEEGVASSSYVLLDDGVSRVLLDDGVSFVILD